MQNNGLENEYEYKAMMKIRELIQQMIRKIGAKTVISFFLKTTKNKKNYGNEIGN